MEKITGWTLEPLDDGSLNANLIVFTNYKRALNFGQNLDFWDGDKDFIQKHKYTDVTEEYKEIFNPKNIFLDINED